MEIQQFYNKLKQDPEGQAYGAKESLHRGIRSADFIIKIIQTLRHCF